MIEYIVWVLLVMMLFVNVIMYINNVSRKQALDVLEKSAFNDIELTLGSNALDELHKRYKDSLRASSRIKNLLNDE